MPGVGSEADPAIIPVCLSLDPDLDRYVATSWRAYSAAVTCMRKTARFSRNFQLFALSGSVYLDGATKQRQDKQTGTAGVVL